MNQELFTVFDSAAGRYMDPAVAPTVEFMLRGFREACATEGHQFAKYPEDYVLYHIGSFDAEKGILIPMEARKIANATAYTSGFGNQLELAEEA